MRLVRLVVVAMLAYLLGRALARTLFALPVEAAWFTGTVAAAVRTLGRSDLANPDDVQTLASVVLLGVCVAAAGVILWLIDRRIFARSQRQQR